MREFKESLDNLVNKLTNALFEVPDKKYMEQTCSYTYSKYEEYETRAGKGKGGSTKYSGSYSGAIVRAIAR
jgi:hypothetical protein